ncbi:MAG TPA: SRPBCC family protein [Polyangiaceae bacterium LLY-WYZ-15_(1-7)]|nr:hypothetical protein [Myxococcales bacterium]MAT27401.1 hypothetical protein [Sandaracinus sp.]HJL04850.1 SRPBCC family protein [Polyangiaceae bacterium LLY-WYZ-15_(1-7)]HJL13229.1 SRPBCC family protein [Polyangiaceae bacterium LLY-WYZ-15_(1-7)]HJL23697.1 SRPBCC family protein [Polyangiaceae bacterium LLY-WYZ-15_(1-7)]
MTRTDPDHHPHPSDPAPRPDDGPLRRALLANATLTTLCIAALLAFPAELAAHLGDPPPALLPGLAAALAGFAAFLLWQATRRPIRLFFALLTTASDLLWVLGSAILLLALGDRFTDLGAGLVIGVAAGVALVGTLQWRGLRHAIHAPDDTLGTRHRYAVQLESPVPRARLWPIVADLGAIAEHGAFLAESRLEGDPGVGALRRCADHGGKRWAEEVTGWAKGERIQLRFRSEEAGFPFPMAPMHGGWILEDLPAGRTRVTIWWAFTARPAWAAPLIVALLDGSMGKSMRQTLDSMARDAATRPAPELASEAAE